MSQEPISITGLMAQTTPNDTLMISLEIDGEWQEVLELITGLGIISHIVEPLGIREAIRRHQPNQG